MKILTLHFKNINSLKGEWKIDFTDIPFSENSLFAITGPTGSGKTTILDAICLALYHSTPRQGLVTTNNELMTRGTGECFCEVEFEVKTIGYRARWYQHRSGKKATGAFQSAKVELAEIETGKLLSNKVKTKLQQIELLTGLDFTRFTKSMMLSQGQFAAFLNASENDRAELLEELTGSEIYGEISQKVFENKRLLEHELEKLQAKQQGAKLLTLEESAHYIEQLSLLKSQLSVLKNKLGTSQTHKTWWDSYNNQHVKLTKATQDLNEYHQTALSAKQDLQSLENSLPARKIQPVFEQQIADQQKKTSEINQLNELDKLKSLQENLVQEKSDSQKQADINHTNSLQAKEKLERLLHVIDPLDIEIAQLTTKENEVATELATTKSKLSQQNTLNEQDQKNHQSTLEQTATIATYLSENKSDQQLASQLPLWQSQFELLVKDQSSLEKLKKQSPVLAENIAKISLQLSAEKKQLDLQNIENSSELKKINAIKLEQMNLLKDSNKQSLKNSLETLFSQASSRESLLNLHHQHRKQENNKKQATQKISAFNTKLEQAESAQTALLKTIDSQKKEVEHLENTNTLEIRISGLEKERDLLKAGEPCTLCGSKIHPSIDSYQMINQSKTEALLLKSRDELENTQASLNKENNQLAALKTNLSHQQSLVKAAESERNNICEQWNIVCPRLSVTFEINELADIEDFILEQNTLLKSTQDTVVNIENIENKLQTTENQRQKTQSNIVRHTSEIDRLKSLIENENKQQQQLQTQIQDQSKSIETQKNKIEQDLTLSKLSLPENNNFKIWIEAQRSKSNFYIDQVSKQIRHSEDIAAFSEKIKAAKITFLSLEETVGKLVLAHTEVSSLLTKNTLKRHDLFANKNAKSERLKLNNQVSQHLESVNKARQDLTSESSKLNLLAGQATEKKQQIKQLTLAASQSNENWITSLKESPFTTQEAFQNALLTEQEHTRLCTIKEQLATQKTKVETIESVAKQAVLELTKTEAQRSNLSIPLKMLTDEIEQLNRDIALNNNESGSISEKIAADKLTRSSLSSLVKEIDALSIDLENSRYLDSLIGSAKGDKFRKFAQGLTLEYLVSLANKQLQRLDGRYLLQRDPREDLSLQICDSWQADEIRNTQTLSGGESFLVSLALALGLSDLVSHKTSIDSLFLDEGFGTLDAQTLDVALNALDGLNASGKMIGVISHVEAMKERIPTQIKVSKMSGMGISKLEAQFAVVENKKS